MIIKLYEYKFSFNIYIYIKSINILTLFKFNHRLYKNKYFSYLIYVEQLLRT